MKGALQWFTGLLLLLAFGCGQSEEPSSGSGVVDLPEGPPSTTTVSGTVTTPDGSSSAGMVVLSPAGQSTAGGGGAFSLEAYRDVPNLVMALVPGKTFGLSTMWTGDGDADIDLDSTIVAFVLTSPLLATLDPERMALLDGVVRSDDDFPSLFEALTAAYGSDSPWDNPDVEAAAHALVGSVLEKVATDESLAPAGLRTSQEALTVEVMRLALNEAQGKNIDREYVDVGVKNVGGNVEVQLNNEMDLGVGSAHSWIVEIASLKIDAYPFSNGSDALNNLEHDEAYKRDGKFIQQVALPQASLFRYFDIVSLVIDSAMGKVYEAVGLESAVVLPGDEPGLYIVRAYSGAWGDKAELNVLPSFPGGMDLHEAAQTVNVALAVWDIVSVLVDTKGVMPALDQFVIKLAWKLSVLRKQHLPDNRAPTCAELSYYLQEVFKTTLELLKEVGVGIAGTAVEKQLDVLIKHTKVMSGAAGTLKKFLATVDVVGKIGHAGDALQMLIEQIWWVSPVETSIIVVGNPFWADQDCGDCPPHHECVSGECVAEGEPRFTLTWNNDDDIDLHVEDPCGNEIYYGNKTATCEGFIGTLDVDDGAGSPATGGPENIYWEEGSAPKGEYRIWAYFFKAHGAVDSAHLILTMRVGNDKFERLFILNEPDNKSKEYVCTFDGSSGSCTD